MFAQIRRDPVIDSLPRWMLIAALCASAIQGLIVFSLTATRLGFGNLSLAGVQIVTVFALWLPLAIFLLFGKAGERCLPFDLGLPLSAKKIWLAHLMALLLGGLAILATSAGMIGLHLLLSKIVPGRPIVGLALTKLYLQVAAVMILVTILMQSRQLTLYRIKLNGTGWLLSCLLLLSAMGLIIALMHLHPAAACVPLVLAVLAGLQTYRSLPLCLSLVPREAEAGRDPALDINRQKQTEAMLQDDATLAPLKVARKGWMSQWFLMRTVLRYLAKNSFAMLAPYPFIILWGLFMSGYLSGLGGIHDDFEYPFLMLAVFVQFNFLYLPLSLLHNLDALPISRKFLCALIVLPGLAAFLLAYGAGKLGLARMDRPNPLVLYQKEDAGLHVPPYLMKNLVVRVPAEYCSIAWNGRVPTISAPWGESHSAFQAPLYKDSRIVVYSPFSTEKESSSRFVAWQISRAISAIHGITIPPEEIKARYLVDSSDGIALRDKGLTLLQDYPELQSQKPTIAHAVFPVFVVVLLFFLVALYLQAFRAGITDTARKWIYYGLLSLCLALHLAQAAAMISRFARPTAASALLKILNRQLAEALPGGDAAVWGLSLLLCAALYWFVQNRFERIEVTGPRSRL